MPKEGGQNAGGDLPSGTTDLRQGKHDTPHLTLVAKTIFADDFQLGVAVLMLEDEPST